VALCREALREDDLETNACKFESGRREDDAVTQMRRHPGSAAQRGCEALRLGKLNLQDSISAKYQQTMSVIEIRH